MLMRKSIALFVLALILFTACEIEVRDVDRSKLKVESKMVLETEYLYESLEINFGSGSVALTGWSETFCKLDIKYREYEKGDAKIFIEDGKLMTTSKSKKGVYLERIEGYVPKNISLVLDGGSGDISLSDFFSPAANLDMGSGDISVKNSQIKRLITDAGSGDISLLNISNSDYIEGDTGSGDIYLENCIALHTIFDTGSGEVEIIVSEIGRFEADTGSGDIILDNSYIKERKTDTGSGEVIEKGESNKEIL